MSKKIQISTVKVTSDVEVIFLNSSLVSKVVRAEVELEQLRKSIDNHCAPLVDDEELMTETLQNTAKLTDELFEAITGDKAYKSRIEMQNPDEKDEAKTAQVPAEDNCPI